MLKLQTLIENLASPDSSVRDKAALELMDIGDESAVEPLLRAIANPEYINHRGTLVYALGAFNCAAFLELLVDLALTGNFEVSIGAFGIIAELPSSAEKIQRVRIQMQKFPSSTLVAEHHEMAFEALSKLTEIPSE
jgi:predicted dinucleotide-utilizing enzyme